MDHVHGVHLFVILTLYTVTPESLMPLTGYIKLIKMNSRPFLELKTY